MASWWSITVPPQFQDITAEAMKNPAFAAKFAKVKDQGGAADATFWSSEDTVVLALDASFPGMPNSLAVLDGFESGARKTSYGTGKEHSYVVDKDGVFIISRQHATNSTGETMWTHRWTGRGTDDALHSVGIVCSGNEATCKSVLATVKVDPKTFVSLGSIPAGDAERESSAAYKAGYITGIGLVCALGLYALVKARQRARVA